MDCNEKEQDNVERKRGRPAGKNRTPLSREERRARNAQYERERRNESAQALAQLAEAVGCDTHLSTSDLLATVINYIRSSTEIETSDDVNELRGVNERLLTQISSMERQLAEPEPSHHDDESSRGCTAARTISVKVFMENRGKKSTSGQTLIGTVETHLEGQNDTSNDTPMETSVENEPTNQYMDLFITEQERDFLTSFGWLDTQLASGRGS